MRSKDLNKLLHARPPPLYPGAGDHGEHNANLLTITMLFPCFRQVAHRATSAVARRRIALTRQGVLLMSRRTRRALGLHTVPCETRLLFRVPLGWVVRLQQPCHKRRATLTLA
jgi:hypothetical protein